MRAAPYEYTERGLFGVYWAALRAQTHPAVVNGLIAGLAAALIVAVARKFGGRHRLKLALAAGPTALFGVWATVARMRAETGDELLARRMLVRWGSPQEILQSLIHLGMEDTPPMARAARIALLTVAALIALAAVHFLTRRRLGADAPEAGRPARIVPMVVFAAVAAVNVGFERDFTGHPPPGAPDMILISLDTLRADHLHAYGYDRETSPNLDSLARDGVLVEQAIAQTPWTLPSHATMLSGLQPFEHGAVDVTSGIRTDVSLFPEWLRQGGYRTGGFVSGILLARSFGFDRGFDVYSLHDGAPAVQRTVRAGLWFMQSREPTFLFLHLFDLHHPYIPPPAFHTRFGPAAPFLAMRMNADFAEFLAVANESPEPVRRTARDRYDELILSVDAILGRLFDELRKADRYKETLIVVVGDHGEAFGDHGAWGHPQNFYEELLRVPLIVKLPGNACAGSRLKDTAVPPRRDPQNYSRGRRASGGR
ncbi:MAG: sulfatase [Deltaproteobacteria bacterium]|nr:sulfatase [Deltaproteobacteria bacterium]